MYLHWNCHENLSCDFVLTWECHVKEPVNQELPDPYMGGIQSMSVIWPERFVRLNFQSITRFWHLHRLRERPPKIGCLIIKSDNFEKCVSEALRRLHGPCKWHQTYIFTWKLPCKPVLRPRSDMGMPCKGTWKPGAPRSLHGNSMWACQSYGLKVSWR